MLDVGCWMLYVVFAGLVGLGWVGMVCDGMVWDGMGDSRLVGR